MGILTLLRNAFGRSRKERTAQTEGATQETAPPATEPEPTLPSQPTAPPEPAETPAQPESSRIPEPRSEPTPDEHDLVKAAFTNVTVPKPTNRPTAPTPPPTPEPEAKAEPEQRSEAQPEPEQQAQAEPEAKPASETKRELKPEAEAKPETGTEPEPEAEPKTEAKAQAEPEAEAKPETQTDPETEAEPETGTKPASEAQAEPKPKPEAEAEAEPETKAEPKAQAEPDTKAEPKPEHQAKADPEAKAEPKATPAPAAADGEDAPQGPPAPDNETGTGGAGGNTDAEGAAEASHPATTAARLRTQAPTLTTAYKAAATTLKKHDLTGARAKVHLVLDRSASMRPYYKDGSAQALAEQTLALAAHLDPEATVHVTFFSTEVDGTGDLTLTDHENKIDELHAALGRMGRTSYHAAVEAVLAHHTEHAPPGTPALVVFQTDGAPDAKTPATQALTDAAASHPNVHFSFVAFGDPENKAFDYLRKLKTGNASHFLAGETPKELTDKELYEGVLATWRP